MTDCIQCGVQRRADCALPTPGGTSEFAPWDRGPYIGKKTKLASPLESARYNFWDKANLGCR